MQDHFPYPPPAPAVRPGSHTLATSLVPLSMLFDRMAYYGVLSVLILYLLAYEGMSLEGDKAQGIFRLLVTLGIFSKLAGGMLGDLLKARGWMMTIGQVLQAAGMFVLCIQQLSAVYAGVLLIGVGTGLYSPNAIAHLGESYRANAKHMLAGFFILFAVINLGASLSTLAGVLGRATSFRITFLLCGGFSLLSGFISVFVKKPQQQAAHVPSTQETSVIWLSLVSAFFIGMFFWFGTHQHNNGMNEITHSAGFTINLIGMDWNYQNLFSLQGYVSLPVLAILIGLAHVRQLPAFVLVAAGGMFVLLASMAGLLLSPASIGMGQVLLPFALVTLGDALAGPVLTCTLAHNSPRLTGTVLGLYTLMIWLANKATGLVQSEATSVTTTFVSSIIVIGLCVAMCITAHVMVQKIERRGRI